MEPAVKKKKLNDHSTILIEKDNPQSASNHHSHDEVPTPPSSPPLSENLIPSFTPEQQDYLNRRLLEEKENCKKSLNARIEEYKKLYEKQAEEIKKIKNYANDVIANYKDEISMLQEQNKLLSSSSSS
mmetsp:Transcript_13831/g.20948  ORF Transcript_13831/g.20948 Transcript_13831/m.20948 type:complete len:128 (+) Transcript_13831:29-412(+)